MGVLPARSGLDQLQRSHLVGLGKTIHHNEECGIVTDGLGNPGDNSTVYDSFKMWTYIESTS